jgi:hypothetical protein
VKTQNPHACGTVNWKVCKISHIAVTIITKVSINPIIRTRTRYFRHAYPPTCDNINLKEIKCKGFNSAHDRVQLMTFEYMTMKLDSIQNRLLHNNKAKFKFGFDRMQIMKCTYYLDMETFAKHLSRLRCQRIQQGKQ